MKKRTMTEAKNDICSIIREAEKDEVLITRHGKPAAIVIGFRDEEEWIDYEPRGGDQGCLSAVQADLLRINRRSASDISFENVIP